MIKTNDKKIKFQPARGHFQVWVKNAKVIGINLFLTVKNSFKTPCSLKSSKICNISDEIIVKINNEN